MPNGYVYTWTGHSSTNFGAIGNWYNQTAGAPATAVPGVNDEALISTSGSITGTGNVYDLGLTGTGAGMTISGQLAGTNLFAAGTVSVASGAALVFSNIIDIGDNAPGSIVADVAASVTVNAGGLLRGTLPSAGYFDIQVGKSGGSGTLTVTGQNALADAGGRGFDVGDDGTGLINVFAGGGITGGTGDGYRSGAATQIGLALGDPGGSGTLLVSGNGAGATFGDLVDVGFGGTGVLTVRTGGTLTAGDGGVALNIGDSQANTGGNGVVTFSGGGGNLDGFTEVGAYGSGSLQILAGSTVAMSETSNTGDAAYWSALLGISTGVSGTINVATQSVLTTSHGLGIGVAGHGELDVSGSTADLSSPTGGSAIAIEAGIYASGSGVINVTEGVLDDVSSTGMIIGAAGSGTLTISAGGTVLCGGSAGFGGLIIGDESGSSGTVSVSGAGATLSVAGQLQDGSAGAGTLSIGSGGTVTAGTSGGSLGLVLGGAGGSGSTSIAGGQLTVTGEIGVGSTGAGTFTMSAGATVTATSSGIAAMDIGQDSGVAGLVTVTGSGTSLTLLGGLTDGASGSGSFALTGGAHANITATSPNASPGLVIAAFAGSGSMTVDGTGTELNETGQMLVGGTGTGGGTLTVSGGATLSVATGNGQTVPDAVIGAGTGSTASIATVTGSGSAWSVAGALIVGESNHATLSVLAGGTVTSASVTLCSEAGSSGSLVVAGTGSLLSTDALQVGGARLSGSVSIEAGTVSVAGNASLRGAVTLSDGGSLDATGIVQIAGNTTVSGIGTLSAAHIVDAGRIVAKGGVMTCIGVITGSGFLYAGGNADIIIKGRENASVGLHFGNNGTFTAASISELAGTITGWEARDALDFTGVKIASDSYSGGTLSLYDSNHKLLGREIFAGSYTSQNFTLSADGSGTLLSYHR